MKVINPRDGFLSDYEVLTHIKDMKARYTHLHNTRGAVYAMKSGNLETVMKEVPFSPFHFSPFVGVFFNMV